MRITSAVWCISLMALAAPVKADEILSSRSITVTGQAERMAVPDEAHLQVNISALDMKLAQAKAAHDEKLKKVMALAKAYGIEAAKVKSQSSTVQPQYSYENNKRVFRGYRAATSLDITVAETDKVGALVEKIISAGLETGDDASGMGLVNVSYSIAEPDKIRDELASDAIANAHSKAERMAVAAGATLGRVLQVNEGSLMQIERPRPMPMMAMARGMEAASDAIAPPAGEQELRTSVTVTYELQN